MEPIQKQRFTLNCLTFFLLIFSVWTSEVCAEEFIWKGTSFNCVVQKFDQGKWTPTNPTIFDNEKISQVIFPDEGRTMARIQVGEEWFAAPQNCVSQKNTISTRMPASVSQSAQKPVSQVDSHQHWDGVLKTPLLDKLEFFGNLGYIAQKRTISLSNGHEYDLGATMSQVEFGFRKLSALSGNVGFGYGAGLGMGYAAVDSVSTPFTYSADNRFALNLQMQMGVYQQVSELVRLGFETGVMVSYLNLPESKIAYVETPSSTLMSIFWQITGHYQGYEEMGFHAALGMNQIYRDFIASAGVTFSF